MAPCEFEDRAKFGWPRNLARFASGTQLAKHRIAGIVQGLCDFLGVMPLA
jgi:hypothetical protein